VKQRVAVLTVLFLVAVAVLSGCVSQDTKTWVAKAAETTTHYVSLIDGGQTTPAGEGAEVGKMGLLWKDASGFTFGMPAAAKELIATNASRVAAFLLLSQQKTREEFQAEIRLNAADWTRLHLILSPQSKE
jgi:hypothetical protein